jgi:pyruvate/2-oxoglutarate dehydrogenase complex dihydrolipoamide acyltransferase (E2) component
MAPTDARTEPRATAPRHPGVGYTLQPVPRERQPVLDRLAGASRRFVVHALIELDVSEPKRLIQDADPRVSWTGFLIATLARAVAVHPEVNARKAGNQILTFDRVDIGATVERHWQGRTVLDIAVVPEAEHASCAEVTEVLHRAKYGPGQPHPQRGLTKQLVRLPGPLRRSAIRVAGSRPGIAATFGPAVGITSIGMFSNGWGFAIPLAPLTLIVTVGGVVDRPVVRDGNVVARPLLPITLSFDHAVIDGAPAARFTETLRSLVESAAAFEDSPNRHQTP